MITTNTTTHDRITQATICAILLACTGMTHSAYIALGTKVTNTVTEKEITTVSCADKAVGSTFDYDNNKYTVVDNQSIRQWVNNGYKGRVCTSHVTDMESMFANAVAFNQPLNNWDVSNITHMSWLFNSATSFNQPLNNWNISKLIGTYAMFYDTTHFNQPLDNWDMSNITSTSYMFYGASRFNQPLNNWDVSKVINMSDMFHGATNFTQSLSDWDVGKVKKYDGFDTNCTFNRNDRPNFR